MKLEKGKFYSIKYQANPNEYTGSYTGIGECMESHFNGKEGHFKLSDGSMGYFFVEDILREVPSENHDKLPT